MEFFKKTKAKWGEKIRSGKWYGKEGIKQNAEFLKDSFEQVRAMNAGDTKTRKETFDQAMARMGLDEKEIAVRQKKFMQIAFIYFAFAMVSILYAVYLFAKTHVIAGLETTCVGVAFMIFAAKQHFTFYQFKKRSLSVSVKSWLKDLLHGGAV